MEITIKALAGQAIVLEMVPSLTIGTLKAHVKPLIDAPSPHTPYRLIFAGAQLEDACTLAHCTIQSGYSTHMVHFLCGD